MDEAAGRAGKGVKLDVRASEETRRILRRAAAPQDEDLSDFVRSAAEAEARAVLTRSTRIELDPAAFDRFVEACENPAPANAALRRAARRAEAFDIE